MEKFTAKINVESVKKNNSRKGGYNFNPKFLEFLQENKDLEFKCIHSGYDLVYLRFDCEEWGGEAYIKKEDLTQVKEEQ